MLVNSRGVRIEWGDCDPAGIVFYPRFFAMFDASTTALFERVLGMTKYQFLKHYSFTGYPLVTTRARFLSPTKFGDDVVIESGVKAFNHSSFEVEHRLMNGDKLAVEGYEARVWVDRDPADSAKIKSAPIPAEVIAKFR